MTCKRCGKETRRRLCTDCAVEVNLVEAVPENVCYECGSIHPTKNMLQRGSNSYMCMKCYAYELGVK
jgi:NMD protein affecting ribosome stability and mRNA decay